VILKNARRAPGFVISGTKPGCRCGVLTVLTMLTMFEGE
jgi:hypothetical protein